MAFVCRFTQFNETDTCIFKDFLHFVLMLVADLNNDTRIFGEQNLHDICLFHFIKADFQTAFYVGKAHFEQSRDQTTS